MKKHDSNPTEILTMLSEAGLRGATTGEIIRKTKDASHTKSIWRLRSEGYDIVKEPIEGQRQFKYVLIGDRHGKLY